MEVRGIPIVENGQETPCSGSLQICKLYENLVLTGHVSDNHFNHLWGLSDDLPSTPVAQLTDEMSNLTITRQQPTKIFIGGLSSNTTVCHIYNYFKEWGALSGAFVVKDNNKKSKGYGYAVFRNEKDYNDCLKIRRQMINGNDCEIKPAYSKDEISQTKQVFIGGLSAVTTGESLRRYFENKLGNVVHAFVVPHGRYGFVTFASEEHYNECLKTPVQTIDNHQCDIKPGKRNCENSNVQMHHGSTAESNQRRPAPQHKKVFIGGLSKVTTDLKLRKHFEYYGKVVRAWVVPKKSIGFVVFAFEIGYRRCLGYQFQSIDNHTCEVKIAIPQADKTK